MLFCLVWVLALCEVFSNDSNPSGIQSCNAVMKLHTHVVSPQMSYLTFAVDFSVFLSLGGRLQALAAFCTAEAVLMPRL